MTRAPTPLAPMVTLDINLLPYRDEARLLRRRRATLAVALAGALAIVTLLLLRMVITHGIEQYTHLNDILTQETEAMDKQIGEILTLQDEVQALTVRQEAIAELQRERGRAPMLFEQLSLLVPPNLHLTTLKQSDTEVVVTGVATSNSDVSSLLANLNQATWVGSAELLESRKNAATESRGQRAERFQFSVKFTHAKPASPAAGAPREK